MIGRITTHENFCQCPLTPSDHEILLASVAAQGQTLQSASDIPRRHYENTYYCFSFMRHRGSRSQYASACRRTRQPSVGPSRRVEGGRQNPKPGCGGGGAGRLKTAPYPSAAAWI